MFGALSWIKVAAIAVTLAAVAAGAGWTGYRVGAAAGYRAQASVAKQALDQASKTIVALRAQVAARDAQSKREATIQQAQTAAWSASVTQLSNKVQTLREDLGHANVAPAADCRDGAQFVRDYDAAAGARRAAPAGASSTHAPR